LSFQTIAIRLLLTEACKSSHFNFSVVLSRPHGIPLLFYLTAL